MRSFTMATILTAALSLPNLSLAQCAGCDADYNQQDRALAESIYQHQQIDGSYDQSGQDIDDSYFVPRSLQDGYRIQGEELRELDHAAENMGVGYPGSTGGGAAH